MSTQKVLAKCSSCSGTGLYRGMCEIESEPVICLDCNGTGAREITYEPYSGRVTKRGIRSVHRSRGSFILSCGAVGESMTYEEFLKNYPEPRF